MKTRQVGGMLALALTAVLVAAPAGEATLKRTRAVAGVHSAYAVRADTRTQRHSLVIRTLRLLSTRGAAVRVDCPRGCRRVRGPAPQITHRHGDTTVAHLNVLLRGKLTLRLRVIVPSATSRYLLLGVRHKRLAIVGAGCLGAGGKRAACPKGTPPQQLGSSPTPGPSGTPTPGPSGTPAPSATPLPGANPRGALLRAQRLDASTVQLDGWARDADADASPLTVRALADGNPAGQAVANLATADAGPHGFSFSAGIDEAPHTMCVVATNLGGGADMQLPSCIHVAAFADLDANGSVGCEDLAILQAHYGGSGGYSSGDLNHDGKIDLTDMSLLLSHMSQSCS